MTKLEGTMQWSAIMPALRWHARAAALCCGKSRTRKNMGGQP
jgi:hypothetical protein